MSNSEIPQLLEPDQNNYASREDVEITGRRRTLRIGGYLGMVGLWLTGKEAYAPWLLSDDPNEDGTVNRVNLLRPQAIKKLPEGTKLTSISGETVTIGVDHIDYDTRGGFTSYGIREAVELGTPIDVFTANKPRPTVR